MQLINWHLILSYVITGEFIWLISAGSSKAGEKAGFQHYRTGFRIKYNNKYHLRKNLVWVYHNGEIPVGYKVIHKESNLDDRIENLELRLIKLLKTRKVTYIQLKQIENLKLIQTED